VLTNCTQSSDNCTAEQTIYRLNTVITHYIGTKLHKAKCPVSGPAFTFIPVLSSSDLSIRFILPLERSADAETVCS